MNPLDLTKSSPLRALDKLIDGGLGRGNVGIVSARHGVGKTPFVVGIALDSLLRGDRVLHVSLDTKVDHVRDFYEQIFTELMKTAGREVSSGDFVEFERSRRIHAYLGDTFSPEKLATAVDFMSDHASFAPDLIVIDAFDFNAAGAAGFAALRDLAQRTKTELWMTAVRHRDEPVTDADGIPQSIAPFKGQAHVIIDLENESGQVRASVLKPSGAGRLPLVLDPTTMLIRSA